MKQKIQAGTIADLGTLIKAISDALFRWMDKLDEWGADVSKPKKAADGSLAFDIETKDHQHTAHVRLIPEEGEDEIYDIEVTPKGAAKEMIKGVPGAYISKRLEKWMVRHDWDLDFDDETSEESEGSETSEQSEGSEESEGNTQASTHVRFSLKKVTGSTGTNVVLTAVNASTNLVQASGVIQDIVANDEFCEGLTEAPQTFEACPCEDGTLDVNPCTEECVTTGTYAILMAVAVNLWGDLKTIHWNAVGSDFFDLHEKLDEYISTIEDDLDVLGELAMEYDNFVPNPIEACAPMPHVTPGAGFTKDIGFEIVRSKIMEFVGAMDCAYVNFPHDVQAELNSHIRYWRKEAEYKIRRQGTNT